MLLRHMVLVAAVVLLDCGPPPTCAVEAPRTLDAFESQPYALRPTLDRVELVPSGSCPVLSGAGLTGAIDGRPLTLSNGGGNDWAPAGVGWPGTPERCTCVSASAAATPVGAVDQARFEVHVEQGGASLWARYDDVSNAVMLEELPRSTPTGPRVFRFRSGFGKVYRVTPASLDVPRPELEVLAVRGGAQVVARTTQGETTLTVEADGAIEQLSISVKQLSHVVRATDCRGARACEDLLVLSRDETFFR